MFSKYFGSKISIIVYLPSIKIATQLMLFFEFLNSLLFDLVVFLMSWGSLTVVYTVLNSWATITILIRLMHTPQNFEIQFTNITICPLKSSMLFAPQMAYYSTLYILVFLFMSSILLWYIDPYLLCLKKFPNMTIHLIILTALYFDFLSFEGSSLVTQRTGKDTSVSNLSMKPECFSSISSKITNFLSISGKIVLSV